METFKLLNTFETLYSLSNRVNVSSQSDGTLEKTAFQINCSISVVPCSKVAELTRVSVS